MERRATNEYANEDVHIRAARLTAWINVTTEHLVLGNPAGVRHVSIEEPVPGGGNPNRRFEELTADPSPSAEEKLMAAESKTDEEQEKLERIKLDWIEGEIQSQLTPLQRFVVSQYYWAGLMDKEIAEFLKRQPELREALGLRAEPKKQNIKKTRHQALEKLKARWEEWHSE